MEGGLIPSLDLQRLARSSAYSCALESLRALMLDDRAPAVEGGRGVVAAAGVTGEMRRLSGCAGGARHQAFCSRLRARRAAPFAVGRFVLRIDGQSRRQFNA